MLVGLKFWTVRCAAALASLWLLQGAAATAQSSVEATVIDRLGNRHEVSRLTYQRGMELEYYVGGQRQIGNLADVDWLKVVGETGAEELGIHIRYRSGRLDTGRVYDLSARTPPHGDLSASPLVRGRFEGATELGPFLISLSQVSQVIVRHEGEAEVGEPALEATVVDLQGKRYEVRGVRYRGGTRFEYLQGRARRSKELSIISQIEFSQESLGSEVRTVTVTFWSGKSAQGMVEAGIARLAGETDRMYADRVGRALTGRTAAAWIEMPGVQHVQ